MCSSLLLEQCPGYVVSLIWGLRDLIAAILWGALFRICSEQHTASLCSFHQVFSPSHIVK